MSKEKIDQFQCWVYLYNAFTLKLIYFFFMCTFFFVQWILRWSPNQKRNTDYPINSHPHWVGGSQTLSESLFFVRLPVSRFALLFPEVVPGIRGRKHKSWSQAWTDYWSWNDIITCFFFPSSDHLGCCFFFFFFSPATIHNTSNHSWCSST